MKVLVLTSHPPFPAQSGDKIGTLNAIYGLMKQDALVDVLTLCNDSDRKNLAGLAAVINGQLIDVVMPNKAIRIISATLSCRSLVHSRFFSSKFLCKFREIANNYDIIYAHHSYMAQYVVMGGDLKNTLKIHDIHVLESNVMNMRSCLTRNPLKKVLFKWESRRLWTEEQKCFSSFERNYSYGDYETDALKKIFGEIVKYRPIGIDTDCFTPSDGDENTLVFFGDYKWFPNYDGILYILESVFPKLKKRVPDAKLIVAGRNADKKILSLCIQDGVTFVGEVTSIDTLLSGCSYVLALVRIGGGIRLKVIESLAAGKIVISNVPSAEGILDKTVIIVDDDLNELVEKIDNLMRDKLAFNIMRQKAIDYAVQNHSIEASTAYLLNDIKILISKHKHIIH